MRKGIHVPVLGGRILFGTRFCNYEFSTYFKWRNDPKPATGVTNVVCGREQDYGYVLFGDYDNTCLYDVEKRLREVQPFMRFPEAYIIQSGARSFHVIIPTVHTFNEQVIFTALTDSGHDLEIFRKAGEMTLRYTPKDGIKPIAVRMMSFKGQLDRPQSEPHLDFLEETYGFKTVRRKRLIGEGLERKEYEYWNNWHLD